MSRLLFANSADARRDDRQIFPDRKDSISSLALVLCSVNTAITAIDTLGMRFRCGILAGFLFSAIIVLLTVYGTYIYIGCTAFWRCSVLEHIWSKAFSPRYQIVIALISVCTVVFQASWSLTLASSRLQFLVNEFTSGEPPVILANVYFLLMLLLVVLIPICAIDTLGAYVKIAGVCVLAALVSLIHTTYWFCRRVAEFGFNHDGSLALFKADTSILFFISQSITDYQLVPISWPGPRHLRSSTTNRVSWCYLVTLIILFILTTARGFLGYCILGGENVTLWIRGNYGSAWYVRGAEFCELINGIGSVGAAINPGRYVILNVIEQSPDLPPGVWPICGFTIALLAAILAGLRTDVIRILALIRIIGVCLLSFVIPSALFIKTFGSARPAHCAGSVALILAGAGLIVISIYQLTINE